VGGGGVEDFFDLRDGMCHGVFSFIRKLLVGDIRFVSDAT